MAHVGLAVAALFPFVIFGWPISIYLFMFFERFCFFELSHITYICLSLKESVLFATLDCVIVFH